MATSSQAAGQAQAKTIQDHHRGKETISHLAPARKDEKMRKITLVCGDRSLTTTCKGLSQHIYNKLVVHSISKAGKDWYNALPDDSPPVWVYASSRAERLDYLSSEPIP